MTAKIARATWKQQVWHGVTGSGFTCPIANSLLNAVSFFATHMAGALPVVLSTRWTHEETSNRIQQAECDWVLSVEGGRSTLTATANGAARERPLVAAAQIIFTSATTGDPRAVMASHANITKSLMGRLPRAAAEVDDTGWFVHGMPIGTNAAQSMLFTALVEGDSTLVLPNLTARAFIDAVQRRRATGTLLVPSTAHAVVRLAEASGTVLDTLTNVGLTGARSGADLLSRLAKVCPLATIRNFYVSTESWPVGLSTEYDPTCPNALGRPADPDGIRLEPCGHPGGPHGESVGELLLRIEDDHGRMYVDTGAPLKEWVRTGDLAYVDKEGRIVLVDRQAHVINTGGYKVGPGEVKDALLQMPGIADSAVFGVEHPALGHMVTAAVVPEEGAELDQSDVVAWLSHSLSIAKVPKRVLVVPAIPLTTAGKEDVRALRELYEQAKAAHEAPRDEMELQLVKVWEGVLGTMNIGRSDDFFDLGGDSLAAAELVVRVRDVIGRPMTEADVMAFRTVESQADEMRRRGPVAISAHTATDGTAKCEVNPGGVVPVQRRLSRISEMFEGVVPPQYNVTDTLIVEGELSAERMRAAQERVCHAHPSLRSVPIIDEAGAMVSMKIMDAGTVDFTHIAVDSVTEVGARVTEALSQGYGIPGQGRYGRLTMVSSPGRTDLVLSLSPLVADGWSVGTYWSDLETAYRGIDIDNAPSFATVTDEVRRRMESPAYTSDLAFWKTAIQPGLVYRLRSGRRVENPTLDSQYTQQWDADASSQTDALARFWGVTPYVLFQSMVHLVLREYLDTSIPVQYLTPLACRRSGQERVIGPCAVTSVLRVSPAPDDLPVKDVVARVAANLMNVQHRALPALYLLDDPHITDLRQVEFSTFAVRSELHEFANNPVMLIDDKVPPIAPLQNETRTGLFRGFLHVQHDHLSCRACYTLDVRVDSTYLGNSQSVASAVADALSECFHRPDLVVADLHGASHSLAG